MCETPPCSYHYPLSGCFPIPSTFGVPHFVLLLIFIRGPHLSLSPSLSFYPHLPFFSFLTSSCFHSLSVASVKILLYMMEFVNAYTRIECKHCLRSEHLEPDEHMYVCSDFKDLGAPGRRSWAPEHLPQPVSRGLRRLPAREWCVQWQHLWVQPPAAFFFTGSQSPEHWTEDACKGLGITRASYSSLDG